MFQSIFSKTENDNALQYKILGITFRKNIKKQWYERLIAKAAKEQQNNILIFDSLTDKYAEAADGLILFQYLQEQKIPAKYIIYKENPKTDELKNLKDVIILEHQSMFLTNLENEIVKAKYVITSFGAGALVNPLLTKLPFLEYIFIEHGVTYLKEWVSNAYNPKNFNRILCPTRKTLSLYLNNKVWPENKIIKCGMLRWNNLGKTNTHTKDIFLFFTWRISFLPEYKINPDKIQYFNKINSLLNNKQLTALLKKNHITLTVGCHHAMLNSGLKLKVNNPFIKLVEPDKISRCISRSDMLITDYSSLCFDFMFQDKPVIFYKFDAEDKLLCNIDKQNMAYAQTKDKEFYNCLYEENEVIEKIKYYIESGFILEKQYKKINDSIFFDRKDICKTFYNLLTEEKQDTIIEPLKNRIPIVICADNNYAPYACTTIKSIKKNNRTKREYDFIIFHENISAYKQKLIKYLEDGQTSIRFVNIAEHIDNNKLFYSHSYFSKSMYSRFFIPKIMKNYSKVIYLDCDIIANCDLAELYDFDIKNHAAAAVQDMSLYITSNKRTEKLKNKLKFDSIDKYFNSGLLLMNIKELNKMQFLKQCIMLLLLHKNLDCPDQDILNMVLKDKVKILPSTYNHLYHLPWNGLYGQMDKVHKEQYLKDHGAPKIIHYTSRQKPWNYPWNEYADLWWKYTKENPFYEEIIYKNLKQGLPDKAFIEQQIKHSLKRSKTKYRIYKILARLSFGKYKKRFQNKMEKYR